MHSSPGYRSGQPESAAVHPANVSASRDLVNHLNWVGAAPPKRLPAIPSGRLERGDMLRQRLPGLDAPGTRGRPRRRWQDPDRSPADPILLPAIVDEAAPEECL